MWGLYIFDDNIDTSYSDDDKNRIYPSAMFDPYKSTLEVTTPSFSPNHPLIKNAKNLFSEYDYFIGICHFLSGLVEQMEKLLQHRC